MGRRSPVLAVPRLPDEGLDNPALDHAYRVQGDVVTEDLIETCSAYKREH